MHLVEREGSVGVVRKVAEPIEATLKGRRGIGDFTDVFGCIIHTFYMYGLLGMQLTSAY